MCVWPAWACDRCTCRTGGSWRQSFGFLNPSFGDRDRIQVVLLLPCRTAVVTRTECRGRRCPLLRRRVGCGGSGSEHGLVGGTSRPTRTADAATSPAQTRGLRRHRVRLQHGRGLPGPHRAGRVRLVRRQSGDGGGAPDEGKRGVATFSSALLHSMPSFLGRLRGRSDDSNPSSLAVRFTHVSPSAAGRAGRAAAASGLLPVNQSTSEPVNRAMVPLCATGGRAYHNGDERGAGRANA